MEEIEIIEIMGRSLAEIRRIIAWYESLGSPSLVETDQEREVGQEPVKAMPDGRLSEIVAAEWLRTHELSGETLKIITQPPGRRS